MTQGDLAIRIVKWVDHFENNRTKDLKHMGWVPIPNKMDGDGYTELVDHPSGAAHFGIWIAMVEIASKCNPRGTLVRSIPQEGAVSPQEGAGLTQEGAAVFLVAHNSATLGRISRFPRTLFDEAIPRLRQIGWIEYVSISQVVASIPQEGAVSPQEGASSRARRARFPSLPFSSVPEGGLGETNGAGGNAVPVNFEIRDWFERQYARHPNKRDKILGEQQVSEHLRLGKLTLEDCERTHIAWCESEDWRWKNGAKVKQTYAQWISDEGYRYMPNGHAKAAASPYETPEQMQEREAREHESDEAARAQRRAKATRKETTNA